MEISANRADGETSRIERLTRFNIVLMMYSDKLPYEAIEICFLHDHKGTLSIGFASEPTIEQVEFISSAWDALEFEPHIQWAVANKFKNDILFTSVSAAT